MKINSAQFVKSIVGPDDIFLNKKNQFVFIGRSNVGKSSLINSLVNQKKLAKISSMPGKTTEINLFLINNLVYLVDLPGYGFAKVREDVRNKISNLINWFFFESGYIQKKIFLIIDAEIGPTKDDLEMLYSLEEQEKDVIIVANKVDKIKNSEYKDKLNKLSVLVGNHKIIPYSTKKRIGVQNLLDEIDSR